MTKTRLHTGLMTKCVEFAQRAGRAVTTEQVRAVLSGQVPSAAASHRWQQMAQRRSNRGAKDRSFTLDERLEMGRGNLITKALLNALKLGLLIRIARGTYVYAGNGTNKPHAKRTKNTKGKKETTC